MWLSGFGESVQMDVQEDLSLRREETAGTVRDDGAWPGAGAGAGAARAGDGGGPHPEHGLPLGDARLPLPGHRHVRGVGAVGLPGQRLLLRHLTAQGENVKDILLYLSCFLLQISCFYTFFLVHLYCLIFNADKLLSSKQIEVSTN